MKHSRTIVASLLMLVSLHAGKIEANAEEGWTWPVSGELTDYFGTRGGRHYGIDVAAAAGTPILAASGGTVTKSYYSTSYGHVVFVRHDNGYEAVYAHMKKRLVRAGESVKDGQTIGEVGNTGHSYGAHLHFEVHEGPWNYSKTNAINPLRVLGSPPHEMASASSYVVQRGDTLTKIASRFGLTVDELKRMNDLDHDTIYPAQKLVIN